LKLLILFNQHAAHGRAKSLQPNIELAFKDRGVTCECLIDHAPWQGIDLIQNADLQAYDGVVAAGGDGTLFELINGYQRNVQENKPPIGVLPLGTGNSFARELDLGGYEWQKAVNLIAAGHTRACDVGRFVTEGEVYYFLNILGFGFVSDVNATSSRFKWMGNTSYSMGVFWQLALMKTYPLVLELDGERLERTNFFVEIANTQFTGATFHMAPKAKIDDGLLDVVLLNKTSRLRVLKLFPTIFKGTHIEQPEVEMFQARSIRVLAPAGKTLTPDGEQMGSTPIEVTCLPGAIDVFCP